MSHVFWSVLGCCFVCSNVCVCLCRENLWGLRILERISVWCLSMEQPQCLQPPLPSEPLDSKTHRQRMGNDTHSTGESAFITSAFMRETLTYWAATVHQWLWLVKMWVGVVVYLTPTFFIKRITNDQTPSLFTKHLSPPSLIILHVNVIFSLPNKKNNHQKWAFLRTWTSP